MRTKLFLIVISLVSFSRLSAAGLDDVIVDKTANGKHLTELLGDLEKEYNVDFLFLGEELAPYQVFGVTHPYPVLEFLKAFLSDYYITEINSRVLSIISKNRFGLLGFDVNNYVVLSSSPANPGQIRGKLKDIYSKEPLIGADVVIHSLQTGTQTDINGNYKLKVKPSIYQVDFTNIGYEKISIS